METFLAYLFKASIGISLLYFVYWIFLRKETFYQTNRVFLMVGLILAAILPLFPYHYTVLVDTIQNSGPTSVVGNAIESMQSETSTKLFALSEITWYQGLFLVYLTGVAIFLFRLLFQSLILVNLIFKHKTITLGGLKILENEKYGLPFSFFNIVFINPKFHKQEELSEILAHEKVHIRENHWFDLLIIELLTVVFWFNPFIWFYERSIKQNHEFLADAGVISRGHSIGKYQALLINQLMGMQIIGVTNNLNFALDTNRLKMMKKQKTPRIRAFKLALALPAIALLLLAFAEPSYRAKTIDPSSSNLSIRELAAKEDVKIMGKVLDHNGDPLPGASVLIKGSAVGTISNVDGMFKIAASDDDYIVVSFVGKITAVKAVSKIKEGQKSKNGVYNTKFLLKKVLIEIGVDETLNSPPPPPPPPTPEAKKLKAEQVSKLKKGEKGKEVFYIVEDMPQYPGGVYALAKWVKKMSQKYAKAKKIEGKALVTFTVNAKGEVTNINVVKKANDMAAKAAYAIIDGLENWKPGKQRGKPVSVDYSIVVKFS